MVTTKLLKKKSEELKTEQNKAKPNQTKTFTVENIPLQAYEDWACRMIALLRLRGEQIYVHNTLRITLETVT